jgi:hypothetical protein
MTMMLGPSKAILAGTIDEDEEAGTDEAGTDAPQTDAPEAPEAVEPEAPQAGDAA